MSPFNRAQLQLLLFVGVVPTLSAQDIDKPALPAKAEAILKTHCYRCHGADGADEGGFNYVLDAKRLVARKKIIPGDAAGSKFFKRVLNDMPPDSEKVRPTREEIDLLKQWIEAGAADFGTTTGRRAFITAESVLKAIRDDLDKVNERDRRFTRYFTLTHLYNAGLAEDELQSYRHGLSKLVNSLSWGSRIVIPQPIDTARTILRVDLRDYQWNERVWEAILAVHPYGVTHENELAQACYARTQCKLPYVRGDWFVAAASRPPLYHEVLQLPSTERELERMLRVDTLENIRQERVARAGFNSSGVSRNNRLVERHESGQVVYWKSYDFGSNTGRQNLFAHPLGPGNGANTFQADGGEIIFNLPNGLQGYMLTDGGGRRIDKGPTSVVSDPRRPDRAVVNGLSCMSCHARGLLPKNDQIRDHVLKNPQAFAKANLDTILALYPGNDKLTAFIQEDSKRFQEAVAKTGAPLSTTEPVVTLALRFEAEMDLPLVAAESGVEPPELLKALDRSPRLAQRLGPIRIEGGTIQRQVFVETFPDLVAELKLGDFLKPRHAAYAALIEAGDRLRKEGKHREAVMQYGEAIQLDPTFTIAYHSRAATHHDQKAYDQALRDYTELLRLDPRDAVAFNNRGLVYHDKADYERAIQDYTQALRLDPGYAVAYLNRGLSFRKKNQLDRAISDYTEALRIDPAYTLAYHNRAAAHYAKRELDKAIDDYTETLKLNPTSKLAYNNRGYAYLDQREHEKALADFSEALKLDPKFAVAYHNRGLIHNRKGLYDQAIADFTEAIKLDPQFAKAYWQRSFAYREKGDVTRATADRAKALQLDPGLERE